MASRGVLIKTVLGCIVAFAILHGQGCAEPFSAKDVEEKLLKSDGEDTDGSEAPSGSNLISLADTPLALSYCSTGFDLHSGDFDIPCERGLSCWTKAKTGIQEGVDAATFGYPGYRVQCPKGQEALSQDCSFAGVILSHGDSVQAYEQAQVFSPQK